MGPGGVQHLHLEFLPDGLNQVTALGLRAIAIDRVSAEGRKGVVVPGEGKGPFHALEDRVRILVDRDHVVIQITAQQARVLQVAVDAGLDLDGHLVVVEALDPRYMDQLVVVDGRVDPASEDHDFFPGELFKEFQGGIDAFGVLVAADHVHIGLPGSPAALGPGGRGFRCFFPRFCHARPVFHRMALGAAPRGALV